MYKAVRPGKGAKAKREGGGGRGKGISFDETNMSKLTLMKLAS